MNGRLSNSELLRQIIPQTITQNIVPKNKSLCSIRNIQPSELLAQAKTDQEEKTRQNLLDKIEKLKQSAEFDNVIRGSRLGLSAYQKPATGIPINDLSQELKTFITKVQSFINQPQKPLVFFGKAKFDKKSKKLNFYTNEDSAEILDSVDLSSLSGSTNISSSVKTSIIESAVARSIQIVEGIMPTFTVNEETLKIEN